MGSNVNFFNNAKNLVSISQRNIKNQLLKIQQKHNVRDTNVFNNNTIINLKISENAENYKDSFLNKDYGMTNKNIAKIQPLSNIFKKYDTSTVQMIENNANNTLVKPGNIKKIKNYYCIKGRLPAIQENIPKSVKNPENISRIMKYKKPVVFSVPRKSGDPLKSNYSVQNKQSTSLTAFPNIFYNTVKPLKKDKNKAQNKDIFLKCWMPKNIIKQEPVVKIIYENGVQTILKSKKGIILNSSNESQNLIELYSMKNKKLTKTQTPSNFLKKYATSAVLQMTENNANNTFGKSENIEKMKKDHCIKRRLPAKQENRPKSISNLENISRVTKYKKPVIFSVSRKSAEPLKSNYSVQNKQCTALTAFPNISKNNTVITLKKAKNNGHYNKTFLKCWMPKNIIKQEPVVKIIYENGVQTILKSKNGIILNSSDKPQNPNELYNMKNKKLTKTQTPSNVFKNYASSAVLGIIENRAKNTFVKSGNPVKIEEDNHIESAVSKMLAKKIINPQNISRNIKFQKPVIISYPQKSAEHFKNNNVKNKSTIPADLLTVSNNIFILSNSCLDLTNDRSVNTRKSEDKYIQCGMPAVVRKESLVKIISNENIPKTYIKPNTFNFIRNLSKSVVDGNVQNTTFKSGTLNISCHRDIIENLKNTLKNGDLSVDGIITNTTKKASISKQNFAHTDSSNTLNTTLNVYDTPVIKTHKNSLNATSYGYDKAGKDEGHYIQCWPPTAVREESIVKIIYEENIPKTSTYVQTSSSNVIRESPEPIVNGNKLSTTATLDTSKGATITIENQTNPLENSDPLISFILSNRYLNTSNGIVPNTTEKASISKQNFAQSDSSNTLNTTLNVYETPVVKTHKNSLNATSYGYDKVVKDEGKYIQCWPPTAVREESIVKIIHEENIPKTSTYVQTSSSNVIRESPEPIVYGNKLSTTATLDTSKVPKGATITIENQTNPLENSDPLISFILSNRYLNTSNGIVPNTTKKASISKQNFAQSDSSNTLNTTLNVYETPVVKTHKNSLNATSYGYDKAGKDEGKYIQCWPPTAVREESIVKIIHEKNIPKTSTYVQTSSSNVIRESPEPIVNGNKLSTTATLDTSKGATITIENQTNPLENSDPLISFILSNRYLNTSNGIVPNTTEKASISKQNFAQSDSSNTLNTTLNVYETPVIKTHKNSLNATSYGYDKVVKDEGKYIQCWPPTAVREESIVKIIHEENIPKTSTYVQTSSSNVIRESPEPIVNDNKLSTTAKLDLSKEQINMLNISDATITAEKSTNSSENCVITDSLILPKRSLNISDGTITKTAENSITPTKNFVSSDSLKVSNITLDVYDATTSNECDSKRRSEEKYMQCLSHTTVPVDSKVKIVNNDIATAILDLSTVPEKVFNIYDTTITIENQTNSLITRALSDSSKLSKSFMNIFDCTITKTTDNTTISTKNSAIPDVSKVSNGTLNLSDVLVSKTSEHSLNTTSNGSLNIDKSENKYELIQRCSPVVSEPLVVKVINEDEKQIVDTKNYYNFNYTTKAETLNKCYDIKNEKWALPVIPPINKGPSQKCHKFGTRVRNFERNSQYMEGEEIVKLDKTDNSKFSVLTKQRIPRRFLKTKYKRNVAKLINKRHILKKQFKMNKNKGTNTLPKLSIQLLNNLKMISTSRRLKETVSHIKKSIQKKNLHQSRKNEYLQRPTSTKPALTKVYTCTGIKENLNWTTLKYKYKYKEFLKPKNYAGMKEIDGFPRWFRLMKKYYENRIWKYNPSHRTKSPKDHRLEKYM